MGIIFGYSSYSIYPSILVSTRTSNDDADELNSIKEPQFLKLGTANELSNRYDDYFAASSDPLNGSMIWVAGQSGPITNSSITTSSTKAGTLRPGNSRNSFQKRFVRASDHCANSGAEVIRN